MKLSQRDIIFGLFLVAAFYIIGSSFTGLNGGHVWRQADAYAQILGFMGLKGFDPLDDFFGNTVVYDMPVYQYIIASIARVADVDPLVTTKYVNLFFWVLLAWGGTSIVRQLSGAFNPVFIFLIATSPLVLHYYSAPLPDVMALSLSVLGVAFLLSSGQQLSLYIAGGGVLILATLIKSPVPFVLVSFYGAYLVVSYFVDSRPIEFGKTFVLGVLLLLTAYGAEQFRIYILGGQVGGFAQDPAWYFGTLEQRLSEDFWSKVTGRLFDAYADSSIAHLANVCIIASVVLLKMRSVVYIPFILAFLSGWMVFSNVYFIHDYYQLPVTVVYFLLVGVAAQSLLDKLGARAQSHGNSPPRVLQDRLSILLVLLAPVLVVGMEKESDLAAESYFDGVRYLLRDTNQLLWVSDVDSGPSIGGLAKTQIRWVKVQQFESQCQEMLASYSAILIDRPSPCLARHRNKAHSFVQDKNYIFFKSSQR